MVPTSAVCVALLAAACGGSAKNVPTRTPTGTITSGTATVQTRTTAPVSPSPAAIERAATLTAAKPGFAAKVSARIGLPQFNGNPLTAAGSGYFDPRSSSGTLNVAVELPGLLGLAGPLPAPVRLVGSEAYVQVPSDIASQLGTSDQWLEDSIQALGLGDSLSPPDILREVARDATQAVPGQRATVTIDPASGLVRTITLTYSVAGGYHVRVHLSFTGFEAQPATVAPTASETGKLQTALRALGF
jgi:hypothetical protein